MMSDKYLGVAFLTIVTIIVLSVSCQKQAEIKPLNCWIETATLQFSEDSIQVVYRLQSRGECKVDSFYYYNNAQRVTIFNPDTLVEVFTTLSTQKRMLAGAAGSTTNGVIKVSYQASSTTNNYEAMDQCQQYISTN